MTTTPTIVIYLILTHGAFPQPSWEACYRAMATYQDKGYEAQCIARSSRPVPAYGYRTYE